MQYLSSVLADVVRERHRQEGLKREGKFPYTCADMGPTNHECLTILVEEVGEVARAIADYEKHVPHDPVAYQHLKDELVQVASVAVSWVEGLIQEDVENQLDEVHGELRGDVYGNA